MVKGQVLTVLFGLASLFCLTVTCGTAQETVEASSENLVVSIPDEEKPFHESAQNFVDAYVRRDVAAIGEFFTEDAEFLDELGVRSVGRAAIMARFQQAFDESPGALIESIDINNIRFLGDSVALESGIVVSSEAPDLPRSFNKYAAIHRKGEDGSWRIDVLKDFPRETMDRQEQLSQLAWMVGEWVNEDPGVVVHTVCQLSADESYLLSQFQIRRRDGLERSGEQRTGWDPVHKKLRSWTFDSDGGFFTGLWTRTADGWMLTSTGVNAAGDAVSATAIYQIIDAEMLTWRYENLIIGEEVQAATPAVTMVRRPPSPGINAPTVEIQSN